MPAVTRRTAMLALGSAAVAVPLMGRLALAREIKVTEEMILNDPDAPTGGNPAGDLTIVAFLDYNCPYCKRTAPILARVTEEDGHIRLVYKDWPILRPTSRDGAVMALAAGYQGKYEIAHHALMAIPGFGISAERMREGVRDAGIDMDRLDADMTAERIEIEALIRRNLAQSEALAFAGTPAFLIGPYRASTLDYDGFKRAVVQARAKQAERG